MTSTRDLSIEDFHEHHQNPGSTRDLSLERFSNKHDESNIHSHPENAAGAHDEHGHEAGPQETRFPDWVYNFMEPVFKLKKRNVTIELEIYTGLIQFISCLYVLPVVPFQMKRAGFDETDSIVATAVTCALGCIASSVITDTPFIIAPPTSVSIFYAVSMQQGGILPSEGNSALMVAGAGIALMGIVPPLGRFMTKFIPDSIQAAISVGIGLITALAGATEIELVVHGKYTILDMGEITPEIVIALSALIIVAASLHYHLKGAFCIGLFFGTFVSWIVEGGWPSGVAEQPLTKNILGPLYGDKTILLIFNLFFLFLLTLNGLSRSLSDLAGLTKPSGAIPRGSMLFISCGLTTMLSAYMSGPPILISPETAAGIKAGARCGLSTLVCGILFGIASFFGPIFAAVPAAGTAPLLIMVGVMMFGNCKRIDWSDYKLAVPAYCVLFFIPFTYSILRGVAIGYAIYVILGLYTGEMINNIVYLYEFYKAPWKLFEGKKKPLADTETDDDDEDDDKNEGVDPEGKPSPQRQNSSKSGKFDNEDDEEDPDEFDQNDKDGKRKSVGAIYFRKISKFLDSMELQEGGITSIEHL